MEIKNAEPCPRCGAKPAIVKDPVFFGRMYCTCNNPLCEWYRLCTDDFSGRTEAWAVARWNRNRIWKMREEDGIDWKTEIRK